MTPWEPPSYNQIPAVCVNLERYKENDQVAAKHASNAVRKRSNDQTTGNNTGASGIRNGDRAVVDIAFVGF